MKKLHRLVGLKITPPLKNTRTAPTPSKIQPKMPVSLEKNKRLTIPPIIAKTEAAAGMSRSYVGRVMSCEDNVLTKKVDAEEE